MKIKFEEVSLLLSPRHRLAIEEAKRRDINSIVRLNKDLADFHRKLDQYYKSGKETQKGFKKYLLRNFGKKNFKTLVAKDKGKVVAYFIGKIKKPKPYAVPRKIGSISEAFVLEKYREQGIGEKIFKELINWFEANKIKRIELSVDARNKIGIVAWKKFGFFEFQKKMRLDL